MQGLPLLDDVPKALLVALVSTLAVVATWVVLDRRSAYAERLRLACRRADRGRSLLVALVAAAVLLVVAEDILEREHDEAVLRLDRQVRRIARTLGARPAVHTAASIVSWLTGEALTVVVVGGAAALVVLRRRREAVVLAAGSLGAWLLHGALKVGFQVARPNWPRPSHAVTGYGFPSGHALVTLVVCGLLVWIAGQRTGPRRRLALYAGASATAALAGAARVILDAHWFSDVLGGLAFGVLWLNLVILAALLVHAPSHPAAAGSP